MVGYVNHATEVGYQQEGAVPLIHIKMHSMLQVLNKPTD